VSTTLRQALLIALGGGIVTLIAVVLARRRLITLRYALGWIMIGLVGLLGAALTPIVQPLAQQLSITETALFLAAAATLLVAITIQLSISISGLQAQNRELAQAHALLARRLAGLEAGPRDAADRAP
jgi:hypothetical protein